MLYRAEYREWGGEEFLAILQGCGLADAVRLGEEIRAAIEASMFEQDDRAIRITVSVGTAEFMPGETIDQLLARADQALYGAKEKGKNLTVSLP